MKYRIGCLVMAGMLAVEAAAQTLPPVVERYEQMLVRSPEKGAAFEKVYQHFFEGEGVEKLSARWRGLAEAGGTNAATYWLLLGLLADRQGRNEEAAIAFDRATQLAPNDFHAWLALGESRVSLGKLGPAIEAFTKALAANPPASARPKLFRQLARTQQRNFDAEGAIATWKQFVAEAQDDPFVLEEAGEALAEAERFPEARELFEKLRAGAGADPYQRVRTVIKLAQLEEQQGHTAPARALYESALPMAAETSWMHREVRTRIEELFRRQDDLPGLVAYYEAWLKDHARDVEAALRLSDALFELNKKQEAVGWLEKAAAWVPDRTEVTVALARRLGETGRAAEAVPIMARLVQAHPEELSYIELLGESHWLVFEQTKDAAGRTAAIEQWGKLAPPETKDSARVSHVADLLRSHQLVEPALAEYRRAVALAPALNDLRERLAEYLFDLERDAEAWTELEALGSVESPDFLRLAKLQIRHKAPDAALATVRKGREREPKNFDYLAIEWQLLAEAKRWPEALALVDLLTETAPNSYFLDDVELRYLGALSASGQAEAFQTERVAKLGADTLTERDLRLLARQILSGGDTTLLRKILDEGRARFPNSFPLARLEVEYARHTGDLDGRVRALRRLIELQPKQKTDFLREIANAWREEGRWDEALAAARELIAASPANADGYVLEADLLLASDHFDEGVKKLREAVKLSENPNSLRLRLSRVLLDAGETAKAREILDEAFEAAEKSSDRLSLMPQLTESYFVDGKLDTLIERFRQRQRAEDDGWRYALYLAEIFKQTLDTGAARRELARALAARPKDSGLLRQMVRLADEEENAAEVARYQALLTEAEPSDTNQVALIESLLENSQPDPAFALLQRQLIVVNKTNGAWDRLVPLLAKNDLLGRLADLINAQPGGKSGIETRLQLAVIQATKGDREAARTLFWSIFATKTPPVPLTAEKPDPSLIVGGYQMTAFDQRLSNSYQIRQTVDRVINRGRYGGGFTVVMGGGSPAKIDPADIARDTALLYLAALAVDESKVPQFLTELDAQLDARESTRADRLLAYGMVQAREPLLREIQRQVEDKAADPKLDRFCLGQLSMFVQNTMYSGERADLDKNEIAGFYDTLAERIRRGGDPTASIWGDSDASFFRALRMPDRERAANQKTLSKLDLTKPEKAVVGLAAAIGLGDLARVQQICIVLAEAGKKQTSTNLRQTLGWLPLELFDQPGGGPVLDGRLRMQMLGELLEVWYPAAVPRPSLGNSQQRRFGGNDEEDIPATRFFDMMQRNVLQSLAQQLGGTNGSGVVMDVGASVKELRGILEKQAQTLPEAQRIYPRLVMIHIDAWSGRSAQASAAAEALLTEQPADDDLRLLAGSLLGREKKYPEALAILRQISPRLGSANVDLQRQLLTYGKLGNDPDTARKAALRLASLRLTPQERSSLAADLRSLGLADRAAQLAKQASARSSSSSNPNGVYEDYQRLRKFTDDKNEAEALILARQILSTDPSAQIRNQYFTEQALRTFQTFGKLDDFVAELEQGLEQTPDSLRLNFLLAQTCQLRESPTGNSLQGPMTKLPCWLKLERRGQTITGYHSTDGQKWTSVGSIRSTMPETLSTGLLVVSKEDKLVATADFIDVSFNGQPAFPAGGGSELPAPWTPKDIGRLQKPGWQTLAGDRLQLQAGAGWIGYEADALHLVRQPLNGDGTISAAFVASTDEKSFGEAGIMMRVSDDPKSNQVALVANPGQPVRFKFRLVTGDAEKYWRKVVEIRPGEKKYQQLFATWLTKTGKNDEAFAIYARLMDQDPTLVFESARDLVPVYKAGGRLDELAGRVAAYQPPPNNNQSWVYGFQQIADALEQQKRPDLVEKVARHGLELESYDSGEQLTRRLAAALKAQGREEESMATLMEYFSPKPRQISMKPASQLGFQSFRFSDTGPRWKRSLSISDTQISLRGLDLLQGLEKGGQLAELTKRLSAADQTAMDQPSRALLAFLKLKLRNPAAIEEFRKFAEVGGRPEQALAGVLLAAAREAKFWPGQEAFSLELYRMVLPQIESDQFLRWGRNTYLIELALTEEQLADADLPETVRKLAASVEEDDVMRGKQNRRQFQWKDAGMCLGLLLRAGLEKEYASFLEKMKKTPEGAKIGWTFDEERKLFAAEKKPQAMLWLNDPIGTAPTSAVEVGYELRVEHPYDHDAVYKFPASRLRSIKALEKERTFKFYYGATRESLAPLGEVTAKTARGTWLAEVPPGMGWMRVGLVTDGAEEPSPMVPVCRAKNLIVNPHFEGLANRPANDGDFDIDGWKKLPAGFWRNGTGGPRGDGIVEFETREGRGDFHLIGEKIPLEKGRVYQQGAWVRAMGEMGRSAEVGRRYLDASGAVVKTTFFPSFASFNWRLHAQRLSFEGGPDVEKIPEQAAFLQPVIKVTGGGAEWAGLFLGKDGPP